jgi:hypothetical protein
MAEVKVTRSRSTLAKFREAVEAYRAYDQHRAHCEAVPAPDRFIERDRAEREDVLLQDLERKAIGWLTTILKP